MTQDSTFEWLRKREATFSTSLGCAWLRGRSAALRR
jgi:hypothetical protein